MDSVSPPCISCGGEVRPQQHALNCVACNGWQHRLCNTGISLQRYDIAKYGIKDLNWFCRPCEMRYWPEHDERVVSDNPANSVVPADPLNEAFVTGHCWEPEHLDSSLESDDSTSNDDVIRYRILEKGSKRGGRLLVASNGYTYGSKSQRNNKSSTLWRCSVRSAKLQCPATVSQRGHYFQPGTRPHGHPADPRQPIYKEVVALVKEQIESNRHSTASAVVTDILTTLLPEEQHFLAPKYDLLKRIANRHRAGKRPRVPAATPNATSVCFSPLPLSRQLTGRGDHNVE